MKRWKVIETIEKHHYVMADTKEEAVKKISTWGSRPLPDKTIVKSVIAKQSF